MADRGLILAAVTKLATGEDSDGLTVSRIHAAAGVSRRSFNAHFKGVNDCLFAAVEQCAGGSVASAARSRDTDVAWQEGIHRAVITLCSEISSEPMLARLYLVGDSFAGPEGLLCSMRVIDDIASLVSVDPSSDKPTLAVSAEAVAGMIWGVISHRVLTECPGSLLHIAPELAALAIAGSDTAS